MMMLYWEFLKHSKQYQYLHPFESPSSPPNRLLINADFAIM